MDRHRTQELWALRVRRHRVQALIERIEARAGNPGAAPILKASKVLLFRKDSGVSSRHFRRLRIPSASV